MPAPAFQGNAFQTGTGPVTFAATGTLHERCLQDLAALFQGLNLQGTSQAGNIGGNVYVKSLPNDLSDVNLPAILVATEGTDDPLDTGESFEERSYGYPCAVVLLDDQSLIDQNIRPDILAWRHSLIDLVDRLPAGTTIPFLPSTPECWNLLVRGHSIFEPWVREKMNGMQSGMVMTSSFIVTCCCNEQRTGRG